MTQSNPSSPQSLNPSVVIHGHFYQPPRENPWLEEVEVEPSAAPFHDWNERIENESYRAVVAARLPGRDGRIADIINTLSWISFNFGPTLLTWLEIAAPDTYAALLEADRQSVRRWGHGNAIAHPYHHAILPLSTRRDKVTEVRWGIRDFRRRFGREPEGMWLPETAVDDETLDVLAEHGIRFTILAPHQATPLPPEGRPGLYRTKKGRDIALFIYDGDLSHGVAFGELIRDAERWIARLRERHGLVSIATDGETYGHHHKFGEMALARVIQELQGKAGAVTSYAAVLGRHPAKEVVTLNEPSSWSCAHGVERWRSDCGCKIAPGLPTQQQWRSVLRTALDWLAGEIHVIYEREGAAILDDVWAARDRYDPDGPNEGLSQRARELLELERHALLIFTSCAWFFDDVARIEPVQVLKYAARAIELTGRDAPRLETELLHRLAVARSNDLAEGTGQDIYLRKVKPRVPHEVRLAAGLGLLSSLGVDSPDTRARAFASSVVALGDGAWEVTLRHRRTEKEHSFRVGLLDSEIEVALAESTLGTPLAWRVLEQDLWDRHRALLRRSRLSRLVGTVLSPEQKQGLAQGVLDLNAAVRAALVEALATMEPGATGRAHQAMELLTMLELPIPFDAQTVFVRRVRQLGTTNEDLIRLAARLGFEIPPAATVNPPSTAAQA